MALRKSYVNALCNLNVLPSPTNKRVMEETTETHREALKRKRKRRAAKSRENRRPRDYMKATTTFSNDRVTRKPARNAAVETTHLVDMQFDRVALTCPFAQTINHNTDSDTVSGSLLPLKRKAVSASGRCYEKTESPDCPFSKRTAANRRTGDIIVSNTGNIEKVETSDCRFGKLTVADRWTNDFVFNAGNSVKIETPDCQFSKHIVAFRLNDVLSNTGSSEKIQPPDCLFNKATVEDRWTSGIVHNAGSSENVEIPGFPFHKPIAAGGRRTTYVVSNAGNNSPLVGTNFKGLTREIGSLDGPFGVSSLTGPPPTLFSPCSASGGCGSIVTSSSSSLCGLSTKMEDVSKLELPWRELINRDDRFLETAGLPLPPTAFLYNQLFVYTKLVPKLITQGAPTPPQSPMKWMTDLTAGQPWQVSQSPTVVPGESVAECLMSYLNSQSSAPHSGQQQNPADSFTSDRSGQLPVPHSGQSRNQAQSTESSVGELEKSPAQAVGFDRRSGRSASSPFKVTHGQSSNIAGPLQMPLLSDPKSSSSTSTQSQHASSFDASGIPTTALAHDCGGPAAAARPKLSDHPLPREKEQFAGGAVCHREELKPAVDTKTRNGEVAASSREGGVVLKEITSSAWSDRRSDTQRLKHLLHSKPPASPKQSRKTQTREGSTSCGWDRPEGSRNAAADQGQKLEEGRNAVWGSVLVNPSEDEWSVAKSLLELCRSQPYSRG